MESKPKCQYCNSKLVPIGTSRRNGKGHDDWDTRSLHKKCFKKIHQNLEACRDYLLYCPDDITAKAKIEARIVSLKKFLN